MVKDPAAQRIRPTPTSHEAQPGIARCSPSIPRMAAPCGMKVLVFFGASSGSARGFTPLCPAGHLPLKGGDRSAARFRPSQRLRMKRQKGLLLISPLEGEMPGRAEGGKPHPTLDLPKIHPQLRIRQILTLQIDAGVCCIALLRARLTGESLPIVKMASRPFRGDATPDATSGHRNILFRGFSCTSSI